jgi:glycosyltransferase involved in cell wall biosynthesis
MTPYLSVVIPSYNEKKNLSRDVLDQVFAYLTQQNYTWEVILSDDGSTDGTVESLEKYAAKYPHVTVLKNIHAGKAPTVKAGMLAAKGSWRLFTDFDQSTPLPEIEKLLPLAKQGYQVVIGSREIAGAKRDEEPLYRHMMGKGFNLVVQLLAVPGIHDTQCGFKLFSGQAASLFDKLVVYGEQQSRKDAFTGAFDVELLFLARKHGFKIKEVPIVWIHNETDRVNPIKDSFRMFRDIFRIRLTYLLGKYSISPIHEKH